VDGAGTAAIIPAVHGRGGAALGERL